MLLWVSILSTSCIFDEDRCVLPEGGRHDIMFTVSLEGQRTRAPWSDGYQSEAGVPFDYRINPDQLYVVVFAEDGTRLGQVSDIYYWPINENHTEYQFMGTMPAAFVDHMNSHGTGEPKYRFMVLANCGSSTSGEEYVTYSHTNLDPSKEESAIPMWGMTEADVSRLLTDNTLDLGTISLLRAAAKVEVKLSDKLKNSGTAIRAATLKYYNQTGYVVPSGWTQVTNTHALDQENCVRVYRHAAVNMPFIKDEKSGDYYVYVTEYDNINYSGERNKISLEITAGAKVTYFEDAISFCQYRNGAPVENSHYNIVRNHIYEFEILSIAGSNLVLEYHVADWTVEDWGNGEEFEEHDLSYPTYHNPVVPFEFLTSTDQAKYVIKTEPTMYYSAGHPEDGGFHCYFQIVAPESVQWKPVFMGSKENYRIRAYKVDKNLNHGTEVLYDTGDKNGNEKKEEFLGVCGAYEWFHIVVFPLSDDGADKTDIEFGITYYQQWTDQYINLYVNGEYGNIRWPNSGTNPKIINIRHISAMQTSEEQTE